MLNTTVLTNSNYSKEAIRHLYDRVEPIILAPPVDVETIRKIALNANNTKRREGAMLVVLRFSAGKQIEKAIKIARVLKDRKVVNTMVIVGNSSYTDSYSYLHTLRNMIANYKLQPENWHFRFIF